MDAAAISANQWVPSHCDSLAHSSIRSITPTSSMATKTSQQIYPLETCRDASKSDPKVHSPRPTLFTLLAFTALCISVFLVALDTVLIPTALPTIALSFHIPDSSYAWVGSGYLLANAVSVPFWGKLSDVFGRKPVVLTADTIFLVGSIICGLSDNAALLVAGRVVQGLGGGGVVILVHICVSDLFSIRDRSFYLGTVGAVWACASALGPVLGGIFAQYTSWRWCFFANVPIICVSIVTLYVSLDLHSPRTALLSGLTSLDWLGAATILGASIFLLVGLQLGCNATFVKPTVVIFIVLGSVLMTVFPITQWWAERRCREPLLPLRIFKDISNLSALGVCACDALAFNSVAYFVPMYFQIVLGLSPSITGIFMLAIAVPLATVSLASGYLIERTGRFLEVLQAGLVTMTVGIGLLISLNVSREMGKIVVCLVVIGLGFGPNFGAPLIALQTRIRASDIATGTSAFGFVRMISGAIGVVTGQVIFQLMMSTRGDSLVEAGIPLAFAHRLSNGEALSLASDIAKLPDQQKLVAKIALSRALRGAWIFYTVISAIGLLFSFGIERKKLQRGKDYGEEVEPLEDTRRKDCEESRTGEGAKAQVLD